MAASASSTAPGPGTPAAQFPDPVARAVAQARLERLQAVIESQYRARGDAMVGGIERALVTGRAVKNAGDLAARTDSNRVVNFPGDDGLIGQYVEVRITASRAHSLRGELAAGS